MNGDSVTGTYLHYDPDCTGIGQVSPMWMFSDVKPSTTATKDLAGDGKMCHMAGYLISSSTTPPANGNWQIGCSANGAFATVKIKISTPTCICKLGYSGKNCETGSAPSDCNGVGAAGKQIVVSCMCTSLQALNGAYVQQGNTADGKEFFLNGNTNARDVYLYHDPDCSNGYLDNADPEWIFNTNKPSTTATKDLDRDGATCNHFQEGRPAVVEKYIRYCLLSRNSSAQ